MKKPLTLLLTLFLVASVLPLQVLASGYGVPVSYAGQVIDTMTFNGIRVEAVYAPYYTVSDYDGDSTYSCAALVKRFYKQVYGINVYNLLKVNSTPHISNGSGEFYAVDTPRPGDIIRNNASVHWAIVKDVHGTSVDVFQQNAWYDRAKTQAWVGAVFSTTDKTYTFFRYSGANDASPTWTTVETDKREYLPNETVTFTMNSGGGTLGNTYYRLVVQGDNGFYKTYETGKSVMTLTFDKSQCDNYTAYVIAFNSGGEVKSLNILFSVEAPPTWAKVSTTKTIFEPNEEVTLKLESGGGTPLHTYYTIYIDSSNGFSKTIETGKAFSTLLFDENQCGTYTVYIVAYNYAGAIISSPISFDVAKGCGGNHTWNSGKTTKQPTETAEGVRTYTCTVCGETKTETIPALGHDYQVVVTAPTCTEKGYTTHTCTRCGNSYVDSYVNALGHKTELRNAAAASCTADGYTGDKVCRVCGEVVEKGTVIPAAGHSWDSGEVTKQPTETAEGVKTFTCTVCGETRTEAIPKLEPKPIDPPTPPTPGNPFKDVASGEYFYDPVLWAVNHTP
ncbi:MAG: hypothetical protein IJY66_05895, partial [Clostridia bacterium]|nr:hypothetical protein [Clostridia bacterium]